MADAAQAKKAYQQAVKELAQAQVDEIKVLVREALEAKEKAERDRRDAVERIQLLKRDLDDLRAGRLAAIKERHEKDKAADRRSPVTPMRIERILVGSPPSHSGWNLGRFTLTTPTNGITLDTTTGSLGQFPTGLQGGLNEAVSLAERSCTGFNMVSNQAVANAANGTYVLSDGTVRYF